VDGRLEVGLEEPRHPEARHLEQREERDHEVEARRETLEELLERDAPLHAEHVDELVDAVRERHALVHDVVRQLDLALREDPLERLDEREQRHLRERGQAGVNGLLDRHAAEKDVLLRDAARGELLAGLLVLLVLEEATDERLARILLLGGELVLLARRRRGQEHLRLDVRERRGHDEVLARDVEVDELHHGEVLEVLLRHEADRDVEDVELVFLAEMQEEVERTLERRKGHGVPARNRLVQLDFRHDSRDLEESRSGRKTGRRISGRRSCRRPRPAGRNFPALPREGAEA
jgi:hypothetical protein